MNCFLFYFLPPKTYTWGKCENFMNKMWFALTQSVNVSCFLWHKFPEVVSHFNTCYKKFLILLHYFETDMQYYLTNDCYQELKLKLYFIHADYPFANDYACDINHVCNFKLLLHVTSIVK